MSTPDFEPREGGVKIVFDVVEADVDEVVRTAHDAGFDVRHYYPSDKPRRGGSAPGFVRLGAERAMHEFTEAEQAHIVAAFDAAQKAADFASTRVGTEVWTAGKRSGPAGVRKPRRPRPIVESGAAAEPSQATPDAVWRPLW